MFFLTLKSGASPLVLDINGACWRLLSEAVSEFGRQKVIARSEELK